MRRLFALILVALALLLVAFLSWCVLPWRGPPAAPRLGRLQTLCTDGTRAVSTYNRTLERWETTVNPPCSGIAEHRRPPPKGMRP